MWTEEECRNFEQGLKSYGKDFNLIQANKVTVVLNIIYVQCVCVGSVLLYVNARVLLADLCLCAVCSLTVSVFMSACHDLHL